MKKIRTGAGFRFAGGETGVSLVETIVAVGVLGLVIAGGVTMMQRQSADKVAARDKLKLAEIEHFYLVGSNCAVTMSRNSNYNRDCDSGLPVEIYDAAGNSILPTDGRTFGKFKITSKCEQGFVTLFAESSDQPGVKNALHGGIPWACNNPVCLSKIPRTRRISNGFLEYLNDSYKPGEYGRNSAFEGKIWSDASVSAAYPAASNNLDVRVCPQIGFVERGHSLTRTLMFVTPGQDYDFEFTVHRSRFRAGDSYGVQVIYHFDGRLKSLTKSNPPDPTFGTLSLVAGRYKWVFNTHQDYQFKCRYTFATDSIDCTAKTARLTIDDCSRYQEWNQVATGMCTNFN